MLMDFGCDVTDLLMLDSPHVVITRVTSQLVISLYDGGFEIMGVISCLDRDSRSGMGKATVLGAAKTFGRMRCTRSQAMQK